MTPIEKIIQWVSDKPVFWRHAVRLAIKQGALTENNFKLIYGIAQMEYGVIDKEKLYALYESPVSSSGYENEIFGIKLSIVKNVTNVGVLAQKQQLKFNTDGLNIIYGDNGSGKSSYSRILKHTCLARGEVQKILGNVFAPASEEPSAYIGVTDDKVSKPINWHLNMDSDINLKSIRVFDNDAADHYVSKEESLGYKPFAVKVLESLSKSLDYVKRQIEEELMPNNGIITLPTFSSETKAGKFILSLNASTTEDELKQHIASDDEISQIEPLQQSIFTLKSKTVAVLKKELEDKKARLKPFISFLTPLISALNDKAFDQLLALTKESITKSNLAEQLRLNLLSGLSFDGIGGSEWQTMWNAAKDFIMLQDQELSFPPIAGENCPLCLQNISEQSAEQLSNFQQFIADKTAQEAKIAQKTLSDFVNSIKILTIDLTPYESVIAEFTDKTNKFDEKVRLFVTSLVERKKIFCTTPLPETICCLNTDILDICNQLVEEINLQIRTLADDGSKEQLILDNEQSLKELQDRKLVKENKGSIIKNIQRLLLESQLNSILNQCNTRAVTKLNSELSKSILIDPLVECFNNELLQFGFDRFNIQVKTRGKASQQLVKLELINGDKKGVSQVASEGEQRCISIACFLAEMKADGRKSAIIFDDPVNSLSHKWSQKIAARLVEESKIRQVIIFTHDIVFCRLLLDAAEQSGQGKVNNISLDRSRKEAGIVRTSPHWDSLTTNKRIKFLKVFLRELKKIDQNGTEAEFNAKVSTFYGFLREAWERLVEEKLLNSVVTRFGREIQTNRLSKLIDLSIDDIDRVSKGMSKCSTDFLGHDTASALGGITPTLTDVSADLDYISEYLTELQNKRKRS